MVNPVKPCPSSSQSYIPSWLILNREIRQVRKQTKMCEEIRAQATAMQENIREIEHPELEVKNHDKQR